MPQEANMDRKVLIVDDDPAMARLLQKYLADAGYAVLAAGNGMEALRILHHEGPQIVLADWEMPVMNGLELCQAIRTSEAVGFVYTIILTAHADKVLEAFDAGADDFLAKPPRRAELLARLKAGTRIVELEANLERRTLEVHKANAELAVVNYKLEQMATTDELTGLTNRREAMKRLADHWAATVRYNQPFACIMLDVDHFKRVNDTHGHDAGDVVLRELASLFNRAARAGETVCRVGGEEFLILCPNATAEMAAVGAERLRRLVEASSITRGDLELKVTVSAGVAERDLATSDPQGLLKNADDALYQAKRDGRNRVCSAAAGTATPGAAITAPSSVTIRAPSASERGQSGH